MGDPYLVIHAFFDWANLPLARICLQEWLYAALAANHSSNFVHLHAEVNKLIEAHWLIYVEHL